MYLAKDISLNRQVAIKFLRGNDAADDDLKSGFAREAKAIAALNHPHIVTIYEVNQYEGLPFFVMEYIEGKDLRDCARNSNITLLAKLVYAIQICEGLQEAHNAGIIHRDLKSANIKVDSQNRIKILDFGLAVCKDTAGMIEEETEDGTLAYMSPEQILGKELDNRSDLYSLGTVFYELFTGELPFESDYRASLMHLILNKKPGPIEELKQDIPSQLQEIIMKLLEKERDRRYVDANALLLDLRKLRDALVNEDRRPGEIADDSQQSIAVMPFEDYSADKDLEYFCDGIAEEIISALSGITGLKVVARSSSFMFKGRQKDIREIGKLLNVKTILEGSVRKVESQFRIAVRLSNVADGFQIWSEIFDYEIKETYAVQEKIAIAIIKNLKTKFVSAEETKIMKHHAKNFKAYSEYLKGLYFWNKRTGESINKAIDHFRNSIREDVNYAIAYTGLADAYRALPDYSSYPPLEAYEKAREAVLKALEIDDTLAEAHASLAVIMNNSFDWAGAEMEFKKAIELNPGYPSVHHWYALLLMYRGRFDEALSEMDNAYKLDPLSLAINRDIGTVHFYAGEYEKALTALRKTSEMDYGFSLIHELMGRTYLEMSLYEKALTEFEIEKNSSRSWRPVQEVWIGIAYRKLGQLDKAGEIFAKLLDQAGHRHISPYALSLISFVQGNLDDGFEWLEKAHDSGDSWLCDLGIEPLFKDIKSDSRFRSLLKDIGLIYH